MKRFGRKSFNLISSKLWIMLLSLCFATVVQAVVTKQYAFNDDTQAQRFETLSNTLRCVVCQNQNLAESNADIANDLKRSIHDAILKGQTDNDIIDALKAKYGDFILFSPPMNSHTFFLWFGPFLILLLGGLYIKRLIKS